MISVEKAKLFSDVKRVALVVFTVYWVALFFVSKFLMGLSMGIMALMAWAIKAQLKQEQKKSETQLFEEETPLFVLKLENKNVFYNLLLIFVMYLIPYSSIVDVPYGLPITLLFSAVTCVLGVYFLKRWCDLTFMAYDSGLKLWNEEILYDQIKKYQFIRLKNGKITFELNTGIKYHRFIVDAHQMQILEGKIKARTTHS